MWPLIGKIDFSRIRKIQLSREKMKRFMEKDQSDPTLVSFRHLERLTDGTGLLEHALGKIPRRKEGYTTDDNARALWVCVEWYQHVSAMKQGNHLKDKLLRLIDRYLSFLLWVQREDGSFHNNIGYHLLPEQELPSDDCLGRALWACAVTYCKLPDPERRIAVQEMFVKGAARAKDLTFPRGWAYVLSASSLLLHHHENMKKQHADPFHHLIESSLPTLVEGFEEKLTALYRKHASKEWRWFEPAMTYGNGLLPWSLFCAYQVTKRQETLDIAKESLDFLIEKMTGEKGCISPIGNKGWCTQTSRSQWDQQPLDVMKLALAVSEADKTLGQMTYRNVLEKCRAWYYGENDLGVPMVHAEEGSCYDGLTSSGPNLNQGAESTLSYLLTEVLYRNRVSHSERSIYGI
jgi:hypothetical protein